MAESSAEDITERFGEVPQEVMVELQSMLGLYNIDAEELFFKWEGYCLKMGDDVKLTSKNVAMFKKETQEQFEIEMRAKSKTGPAGGSRSAPRAAKGTDVMNMLDGLVPVTPRTGPGAAKRKFEKASYETPLAERTSKLAMGSSPLGPAFKHPGSPASTAVPFRERRDPGKVMEVLNNHIKIPTLPLPGFESSESRIEFAAAVDLKKFSYKPMHQKLSEASQYFDDRINDFAEAIQQEHNIPDDDICAHNTILPEEVVVVGRIVTDVIDAEKRANEASLLLEGSRGRGEGVRIPLDLSAVRSYALFPGMLVALRATNPTGKKLQVKSVIEPPRYPEAATSVEGLEMIENRLSLGNLNVFVAAGPYTTDDNLDFEGLTELVDKIVDTCPDVVFLNGPFIDTDHPKVALGDFPIDEANFSGLVLEDLFKQKITSQLERITRSHVFLVPSTRDAVSKHVSYPQEPLQRKILGLPTNIKLLPNPCVISINEMVVGLSSADILFHLQMEEVKVSPKDLNVFSRVANHVIGQNHFYPLFPPPGKAQVGYVTPLDVAWLGLAEFPVKPDVLILPSNLPGTVKVHFSTRWLSEFMLTVRSRLLTEQLQ
ncbi:hypothetical protein ABW19_dt0203861 [Dactylella cylindrospora]|nr:hypothetical protein ABW19_dt0203861 [Dactylella cylindrospora]